MNKLPLCLEEIILDYKYQLEHTDKQRKLNRQIESFNRIEYEYNKWSYAWETNGKGKYYWN